MWDFGLRSQENLNSKYRSSTNRVIPDNMQNLTEPPFLPLWGTILPRQNNVEYNEMTGNNPNVHRAGYTNPDTSIVRTAASPFLISDLSFDVVGAPPAESLPLFFPFLPIPWERRRDFPYWWVWEEGTGCVSQSLLPSSWKWDVCRRPSSFGSGPTCPALPGDSVQFWGSMLGSLSVFRC